VAETLVLDQKTLLDILSGPELMAAMADVLRGLAAGHHRMPLRQVLPLDDGALAVMPAALADAPWAGVKAIVAGKHGRPWGVDSHVGAVLLFDRRSGRLLAVADATALTALRTAAVSAVATDALARPDAHVLGLIGAGTEAFAHVAALRQVRSLTRVWVTSRHADRGRAFAEKMSRRWDLPVEWTPDAAAVVGAADIVCTVTDAQDPVVFGRWLHPGLHLNAVGASRPPARELDDAVLARSRVVVDRRESAFAEAADVMAARDAGRLDPAAVPELGEVLLGRAAGRQSPDDITVFRSLGLAVEDVAAAALAFEEALARGRGTWVELGGDPLEEL
jgi:alanine dehydrogenase